jgi:hypothetical protein
MVSSHAVDFFSFTILATVYYQMADFDALTKNTTYADDLRDDISATTQSQKKAAKPE